MTFGTGAGPARSGKMNPMGASRTYFRACGLVVWLVMAIAQLAEDGAKGEPVWPVAVGAGLFAAAFWHNTRPGGGATWQRWAIALLALQCLGATLVSAEVLVLVAMQVPLVFGPHGRVRWMAGQFLWLACIAAASLSIGDFEPTFGYSHLPWAAQVTVTILLVCLWQGFAFFAAVVLENAERTGRELALRNGELQATQTLLEESAKLGERLRISRELHDSAGHLLTALSVNLQLAARIVEGPGAEQVRRAHVVARTLLTEVREVVGAMRDEATINVGLAVQQLAAAVVRPAIHVDIRNDFEVADPARAHALFRCVQEMITNTMRHGDARNLWLYLGVVDGRMKLEARDDGKGCSNLREGNGLRGMRERLEQFDGWLLVETAPNAGFSYRLEIPLRAEQS